MKKYVHTSATHNRRSPALLVPEIMNLLPPQSAVDVGCGTGNFPAILQENRLTDILGVEGMA
jgi:trans-aconitate methyltransferase